MSAFTSTLINVSLGKERPEKDPANWVTLTEREIGFLQAKLEGKGKSLLQFGGIAIGLVGSIVAVAVGFPLTAGVLTGAVAIKGFLDAAALLATVATGPAFLWGTARSLNRCIKAEEMLKLGKRPEKTPLLQPLTPERIAQIPKSDVSPH